MSEAFDIDQELRRMAKELDPEELFELMEGLPQEMAEVLLDEFGARGIQLSLPDSPMATAESVIDGFENRPHLDYLSQRIAQAAEDVEAGRSRYMIVEMPPRSGKSLLGTQVTPAWLLAGHPSWPIILSSYSATLATSWGRQVRQWITEGKLGDQLKISRDSGAASDWETTEGGALRSRSLGQGLTGFGAKVMVIDDPHKNFADAHSKASRDAVWNWWTTVAKLRLHPPSLVIVIMTRWHEDDLVGRLLSTEYPGDPSEWEVIRLPAIAEKNDILGREPGQPLYSPLLEETEEQALARWQNVKESVGDYAWSALYQQRPSPARGAIFNSDSWRFWTTDPEHLALNEEGEDTGKVRVLDPNTLAGSTWLDSWDFSFKGTDSSDFVVGQRWVRNGANRYLIAQQRGRWGFTRALERITEWTGTDPVKSPYGAHVHKRLVEEKANGAAIIESLREKVAGIKPINPKDSKEARARAVTPEVESGNVYLPHPSMPGFEWVRDLISEFRNFPNDAHDDQVDAATQALLELRGPGVAGISVPGAAEAAGRPGAAAGARSVLAAYKSTKPRTSVGRR